MTKKMTHAEYLELPDVKAQDEREKAYYAEKEIDDAFNAQFAEARAAREKAKAEFRQEILEAVWECTEVANMPYVNHGGDLPVPEYIVPRGKEKEVGI